MSMHNLATAASYGFPFLHLLSFLVLQLNTFIRHAKAIPPQYAHFKTYRRVTTALLFLLESSFVTEALVLGVHILRQHHVVPQRLVLYCLLSSVDYGIIFVAFQDSTHTPTSSLSNVWALGLALDTIVFLLNAKGFATESRSGDVLTWLRIARIVLLTSLTFVAFAVECSATSKQNQDGEYEGLLAKPKTLETSEALAGTHSTGYGAMDGRDAEELPIALFDDNQDDSDVVEDNKDDSDSGSDSDSDREEELGEARLKLVETDGGWMAYLKRYMVFVKVLNPYGHHKIILYYGILGLFLLWARFEAVLIPNQLGIVTNKLTEVHGTGKYPWKAIGIWIALRYVSSEGGLGILETMVSTRLRAWQEQRMLTFSFKHVMELDMNFHNSKDSGEVLRAVEQGYSIYELFDICIMTIGPALVDLTVAMFYITYLFDAYVAFITGITGLVYLWSNVRLRSLALPIRRRFIKKSRYESKVLYESVSNWQTVSYFNREKYEKDKYNAAAAGYIRYMMKYYDRTALISMISKLALVIGHLSVASLAASRVASGERPVGSFITLITYWSSIIRPLSTLAQEYRRLSNMVTDAERLLELLHTKLTVEEAPNAAELNIRGAEVAFKDVSFYYDEAKPVLTNINFTVQPGSTVALVGDTGAGKSTIFKTLFRYVDVVSGSIKIDGQDIRTVSLDSLRKAFGIVPQDPVMFNRSIRENVRYARLEATDEEVEEACKLAAIHDKILKFPKQYNSKVGERGIKLSGGELQRLAIARVLLRNPSIVLLDEATSAVDSGTEQMIQQAFKTLTRSRTTLVIAHRLSTIVEADQILVVSDGRIIESGTHDELLAQSGRYRELWLKQTKGYQKPTSTGNDQTKIDADDLIVLDDQ